MTKKISLIRINGGYAGVPEIWAYTKTKLEGEPYFQTMTREEGHEEFKIEVKDVEELLLKTIQKNGFTIEKTNRQKYPRIKIK